MIFIYLKNATKILVKMYSNSYIVCNSNANNGAYKQHNFKIFRLHLLHTIYIYIEYFKTIYNLYAFFNKIFSTKMFENIIIKGLS